MRKYLCSLLVACLSVSVFADTDFTIDDVYGEMFLLARREQMAEVLRILNAWVEKYPQCYQDVATIASYLEIFDFYLNDMVINTGELYNYVGSIQYDTFQMRNAFDVPLSGIRTDLAAVHNDLSSWTATIPTLLQDLNNRVQGVFEVDGNIYTYLLDVLSSISQSVDSLTHLSFDGASVEVSNLADIGDYIKAALDDITVRVDFAADLPVNVTVSSDFTFDYGWFSPIKDLSSKARSSYFTLDRYTRYFPSSWRFNSADSLDQIISHVATEAHSYDILDFLCRCGNALVTQNEDMSMLLCQVLGALKGDSPEKDELRGRAQAAVDDVQSDHDSLKSAFGVDSLQSAADRYFVDLNIDDKFDTGFLGFAHGAGNECPDYINIGPIPFSKIYASMSDYTLQLSTAGLLSFFDVCRQCFTVIWYLFFLTICIFLARFGWAFLKPVFGVISNVLNW